MKSVLQKSSILFFVFFHVSIWGQTNVSGEIISNTTWQVSKSPYTFTGTVRIKDGAKLTIESGVAIFGQNNSFDIGQYGYGGSSGILEANGVTFNSTKMYIYQNSSGTITNCSFVNSPVEFNDQCNPLFTNNNLDANSVMLVKSEDVLPRISGNTYGSKKIYLSLTLTKNLTLKKIQEVDYYLQNGFSIRNGAKLIIENGVVIFGQNNSFDIGQYGYGGSSGILEANGVTFNSTKMYIYQNSSGTITNCSFVNSPVEFNDQCNPLFTNNNLDANSIMLVKAEDAFPRISGDTYGNKKIYLSLTLTKNLTLKKIQEVDYYLGSGFDITTGAKLIIENGVVIFGQNNSFDIGQYGYGGSSGILEANGVTFNSTKMYIYQNSSGTITNCSFVNSPVEFNDNSTFVISKTNFDLFSKVDNKMNKNIDAKNNYWGDATGPKHSTNPSGYGTTISDKVDYIPFAKTPFDIAVGVEEISTSIPVDFSLKQNYPNPFNPSTLINYSVPKQSNVTLIVYDALGREVTTLVNESKLAGNYTLEFNASLLSSGIYFYQMKTDGFIQTKKMLLLR